jgi:hypothetical protein
VDEIIKPENRSKVAVETSKAFLAFLLSAFAGKKFPAKALRRKVFLFIFPIFTPLKF